MFKVLCHNPSLLKFNTFLKPDELLTFQHSEGNEFSQIIKTEKAKEQRKSEITTNILIFYVTFL